MIIAEPKPVQKKIKPFFENLDSLRFFAFFFVFLSHAFDNFKFPQTSNLTRRIYALFTLNGQAGQLGVRFFFVLSGFLITYLILAEIQNHGRFNIRNFYLRRTFRIWPLYFVAVIIGFSIFRGVSPARPLNYFLFLGNMDMLWSGFANGTVGVLWSLSIEEQFYIFWPVIFLFTKRPLPVFIAILTLSAVFVFAHAKDQWVLYFHSFANFSHLAIGGIFAYLSFYSKRFLSVIQGLSKTAIALVYIFGLIMIYTVFYLKWFIAPYFFLSSIFFGFIIVEQNFSNNSFYKFGRLRFASYLGKISYGLYILHPIPIVCFVGIVSSFSYSVFIIQSLAALALSIGLAWVSFNFFEKWFLRAKKRFER